MTIRLKDEKKARKLLEGLRDTINKILKEDLSEKEATEENIQKAREISEKVMKIKWFDTDCMKFRLVSSKDKEITRI